VGEKTNNYPIERQLITRKQAEELYKCMGDDAPGSVWVFAHFTGSIHGTCYIKPGWQAVLKEVYFWEKTNQRSSRDWDDRQIYPAYTGDELGALLANVPGYQFYIHSNKFYRDYGDGVSFTARLRAVDRFSEVLSDAGKMPPKNQVAQKICECVHDLEVQAKATLAIDGLRRGMIEPKNLKYQRG